MLSQESFICDAAGDQPWADWGTACVDGARGLFLPDSIHSHQHFPIYGVCTPTDQDPNQVIWVPIIYTFK